MSHNGRFWILGTTSLTSYSAAGDLLISFMLVSSLCGSCSTAGGYTIQ